MLSSKQKADYYRAFANRDASYNGVFFTGVKTTGIFCRASCSARKPKIENCDFFKTAQQALLAGYRPCKRCEPMSNPHEPSAMVKALISAIEAEPEKRWQDSDVRALGYDPSTVRRQFKQRFGMTLIAYARARRMGLALKTIRTGEKIINAQIDAGYESASGFRDAFAKIMGSAPKGATVTILKAEWIDTPLGSMLAIADETHLHLLEFTDRRGLEKEIEKMRHKLSAAIIPGSTPVITQLKKELAAYFKGTLQQFKTPLWLAGSDFQKSVMNSLLTIPYGTTRSYAAQAKALRNPKAVRGVARANGANQLCIILPCHRVIGSNGKLTGYSGGLARKQWLLEHEAKHKS